MGCTILQPDGTAAPIDGKLHPYTPVLAGTFPLGIAVPGNWVGGDIWPGVPVREQMGYRHLLAEAAILEKKGKDFRGKIILLQGAGLKIELAFCQILGLERDPYLAMLEYKP
ncbi:MAG: DUF4269 domain-containing protein [Chitinophagaceae bacterium]|nr:MAG: DUF4269 domain-containing protein [Chitinophagaceae bacterium]